jgi:hypothetical protein
MDITLTRLINWEAVSKSLLPLPTDNHLDVPKLMSRLETRWEVCQEEIT